MDNFKVIKLRTGETILCTMKDEPFGYHKDDLVIEWPVLATPVREVDDKTRIAYEKLVTQAYMPYSSGDEFRLQRDMVVSIGVQRPRVRYQYEGFVERWKVAVDAEMMQDAIVRLLESVNPGHPPMLVEDEQVYGPNENIAALPNEAPTEQLYNGDEGNGTH
jgi:hypothetical protein